MDVFSSRLQRKLREQEIAESQISKDAEARKSAILKAMTSVRKALQESARAQLGKRFLFELEVTDNEGWPKLELQLIDRLRPDKREHGLIVNASDRGGRGLISFVNKQRADCIGALAFEDPAEITKLPVLLKTTIRRFLDSIAPFVLKPASQQDIEADKPIEFENVEEDQVAKRLAGEDVFIEDNILEYGNIIIPEDVVPLNIKKPR